MARGYLEQSLESRPGASRRAAIHQANSPGMLLVSVVEFPVEFIASLLLLGWANAGTFCLSDLVADARSCRLVGRAESC